MAYVPVPRTEGWMPFPSEAARIQDRGLIAQIRHEGRAFVFAPRGGAEAEKWGMFHNNPETDALAHPMRDDGRTFNPGVLLGVAFIGVRLADFPEGWPEQHDGITFTDGARWIIDRVDAEADLDLGYADLILKRVGSDLS